MRHGYPNSPPNEVLAKLEVGPPAIECSNTADSHSNRAGLVLHQGAECLHQRAIRLRRAEWGGSLFFADFARQATEFSGRRYPELLHHLRAMRLHGAQTYTQFRGDLLVKHAGDDQVKNGPLARCK
jgi:hypothetical protein